jgi:hypothetical protein
MKDPIFGPRFEIGLSNELARIFQGICDVAGTNTAFFIDLHNIRKDHKITYGKLVCEFKPNKTELAATYWIASATPQRRQQTPQLSKI